MTRFRTVSEIELTVSMNSNNQSSETFLVFRKEVPPQQDVIDELLYQAEDEEEKQRIRQSAGKSQPIEVAFKLQDGRITVMDDDCVLFAYLPTQKETHLNFSFRHGIRQHLPATIYRSQVRIHGIDG